MSLPSGGLDSLSVPKKLVAECLVYGGVADEDALEIGMRDQGTVRLISPSDVLPRCF